MKKRDITILCLVLSLAIVLGLVVFMIFKGREMKEWFKKLNCRKGQNDTEYIIEQAQEARKELREGCADLRKTVSEGCDDLKKINKEHGKKMRFHLDNLIRLFQGTARDK